MDVDSIILEAKRGSKEARVGSREGEDSGVKEFMKAAKGEESGGTKEVRPAAADKGESREGAGGDPGEAF